MANVSPEMLAAAKGAQNPGQSPVGAAPSELDNARKLFEMIKNRGNQGNVTDSGQFRIFLTDPNATQEEREFGQLLNTRGFRPEKVFALSDLYHNDFQVLNRQAKEANVPFEDVVNPASPNEGITPEGKRALAEKADREALAKKQQEQIQGFATDYASKADEFRKRLAEDLSKQISELSARNQEELGRYGQDLATSRQKTFELANPYILEDLNRRGLFTSPTAVSQSQSDALSQLQSQDESKLAAARLGLFQDEQGFRERGSNILNTFGQGAFGSEQDILGSGLSALIGGEQSALDSALGLRRGLLERQFAEAQSAQERAYADSLAKKQRNNSLFGSALDAAGNVAGGYLGGKGHK